MYQVEAFIAVHFYDKPIRQLDYNIGSLWLYLLRELII